MDGIIEISKTEPFGKLEILPSTEKRKILGGGATMIVGLRKGILWTLIS
jgi:hypothetical protein